MGKEISRIRLNRLYSESNIFEEISLNTQGYLSFLFHE